MKHTDWALIPLLPRLRRRARRLADTPENAEDMVQDVMLRLWVRHVAGETPNDLENYAMTALANLSRSRWRDHKPTKELEEDHLSCPADAPGVLAYQDVTAAIRRLPQDQAEVMTLVILGETSPQTIAQRLKLPVGTVNSRLARARARLRKDIGLDQKDAVASLLD
ncbi:RNA polymerase sigma factor [Shimia sediminis]|uniref:RNA polymerase sigma factor n=1 Tax=Shimia sediminis TaxID=2497945 RepID=UPI0013DF575E|nr:sigma-70 family RNA polymerase sigma factor [Shimia sediminis]